METQKLQNCLLLSFKDIYSSQEIHQYDKYMRKDKKRNYIDKY